MDVSEAVEMPHRRTFALAYDGESLRDGAMSVREVAPALLAFSELLERINAQENGERARIELDINATREGSFEVVLVLHLGFVDALKDMFTSDGATAIATILTIAGVSGQGLYWLVKRLRGQEPKSVTRLGVGDDSLRITDAEGREIVVSNSLLRAYQDKQIRQSLRRTLDPLEKEGISDFIIYADDSAKNVSESVSEEDIELYDVEADNENLLTDEVSQKVLSIETAGLAEGNKWRVSDGSRKFWVGIQDPDFVDRIKQGEPFGARDLLRARVRTRQFWEEGRLRQEQDIIKVLSHDTPETIQPRLPLPETPRLTFEVPKQAPEKRPLGLPEARDPKEQKKKGQ